MLKSLKLKERLLIGYAIPVVVYLGLAGLVYGTAQQIFQTFKEVERVQSVIVGANDLSDKSQGMIRGFRGYLAVENPRFLEEYQTASAEFGVALEAIRGLVVDPSQQQRLVEIDSLKRQYESQTFQMISLLQNNRRTEALEIFNRGEATQFVEQFDRLNQEFAISEENLLQQQTTRATESLQNLITLVILGSLVLIVSAVTIALWIAGGVARSINQASSAIASSSTEIGATIEQQERTATQQATSVNETTTTMDELGASSRQVAEQAEASVAGAKRALLLTQGGAKAVESTLEGMEELKQRVSAIAEQIVLLSEQTGQIGNISALVSDLANQTNILALNAAVEAVRAGEHGKGFAVVASEIRKLADQSKKSAEKINTLVREIQASINSTVMVTEEGTKTVEEGVQIAQKTADAFTGVAEAVNDVVLNNQQIFLNIKQQAIAVQQVVEAMNALNLGAKETAGGISQARMGTQKLSEAALDLKAIV